MSFSNYKGYPVFHLHPTWNHGRSISINHDDYTVGRGFGYKNSSSYFDSSVNSRTFSFACGSKQEIYEVNEVFDSRKGRYANIWFPSWKREIELTANIGSSDTVLNITDIDYSTYFPASPGTGRHLFIHKTRNNWFARKVTAVPSSTQITIESLLGTAFNKDKVLVSFLFFGRFDIDEIEWNYLTKDLAVCTLSFIELPLEYPTT